MQGSESGRFTRWHWVTFAGSIATAMLFSRFVIGEAVRKYQINDFVVGASGIVMLAVTLRIAFVGYRRRNR